MQKVPKNRLNIPFTSKAFDFINLSSILRCDNVMSTGPEGLLEEKIPMVVYSLSEPIRSKVMNYTKFVSKLDLGEALNSNLESVPCNCFSEKYQHFVDGHHQHVITGNLRVVENIKLRTFC